MLHGTSRYIEKQWNQNSGSIYRTSHREWGLDLKIWPEHFMLCKERETGATYSGVR
eukprot:COSAG06_NODE_54626_length_293_cov_1.329897_1_plen_55_part_01